MAVSFTRFSWWLRGSKQKESVSSGSSFNSSSDWGFGLREPDLIKFPTKMASPPRKAKKKWQGREERRIDWEYDVVVVPSDGVCLSASDSDGPDWSVGWVEPHGPDFDERDDGFAVLVPCYKSGCKELVGGSNNELLSAIKNLPSEFSPEGKNYMKFLSSHPNFRV